MKLPEQRAIRPGAFGGWFTKTNKHGEVGSKYQDILLREFEDIVKVGAPKRENPLGLGDTTFPGVFYRRENNRGPLVDADVGYHQLRVGIANVSVCWGWRGDLLCRAPDLVPRVGVVGGDLARGQAGIKGTLKDTMGGHTPQRT